MDVRRVVVLRPKWIRDETLKRVLHRVLHRRTGQNVVPLPHLLPGGGGGGGTSRAMPSLLT